MSYSIRQARRGIHSSEVCCLTGQPLPTDRAFALYDPRGGELHPLAEHSAPRLARLVDQINELVTDTAGDSPEFGVALASDAINASTTCGVSLTRYGIQWEPATRLGSGETAVAPCCGFGGGEMLRGVSLRVLDRESPKLATALRKIFRTEPGERITTAAEREAQKKRAAQESARATAETRQQRKDQAEKQHTEQREAALHFFATCTIAGGKQPTKSQLATAREALNAAAVFLELPVK